MRGGMPQDIDALGAVGQHRLDGGIALERDAQVEHLAIDLRRNDIADLARPVEQHITNARASFDGAAGSIHCYRDLGTHLEKADRIDGIQM